MTGIQIWRVFREEHHFDYKLPTTNPIKIVERDGPWVRQHIGRPLESKDFKHMATVKYMKPNRHRATSTSSMPNIGNLNMWSPKKARDKHRIKNAGLHKNNAVKGGRMQAPGQPSQRNVGVEATAQQKAEADEKRKLAEAKKREADLGNHAGESRAAKEKRGAKEKLAAEQKLEADQKRQKNEHSRTEFRGDLARTRKWRTYSRS